VEKSFNFFIHILSCFISYLSMDDAILYRGQYFICHVHYVMRGRIVRSN
jgi:hypothetical protein